MKNFLTSLLFCCAAAVLTAQEFLKLEQACSFGEREDHRGYHTYNGSMEARSYIDEILRTYGLECKFSVISGDCKNALAAEKHGNRYIMYSTTFLEEFKKQPESKWAAYCVLAHEIGHHLNFHDFNCGDSQLCKKQELESDKFAGSALFRLGATLNQAQSGIKFYTLENETFSHPGKLARLEAVAAGWKQASEVSSGKLPDLLPIDTSNRQINPTYWFEKGLNERDYSKRVEFFSKAIELNPKFSKAYIERGIAKNNLGKFQEGILDFDISILLDANSSDSYYHRGTSKSNLGLRNDALKDLDFAIRINGQNASYFNERGMLNRNLKNYDASIRDFNMAIEIDPKADFAYYNRGGVYTDINKFEKAAADFGKAFEIAPRGYPALVQRGLSYRKLGKYKEALWDFEKVIQLAPNDAWQYYLLGETEIEIKQYSEGIKHLDKAFELGLTQSEQLYTKRGEAKAAMALFPAAIQDFDFALSICPSCPIPMANKGCSLARSGNLLDGIEWLVKSLRISPSERITKDCLKEATSKL